MKQILQNLANGETTLAEVPSPQVLPGHLLIHTRTTLVSAGTERMMVDFGRAGWIAKARQQPDKVRMVLDKVRTDGLMPTIEAVRSKLDQPLALGYCNVGVVVEVGEGVEGFEPGDRVVSNGKHAEVVCVPKNLCAKIPDGVEDEAAAFTVLAAIGLQGIRLAAPTLGECVVVSGLGLIGLLTVQLLRAQGCRVLGLDFDPERLALAERFGAQTADLSKVDPLPLAERFSRGRGVDAVLITASTSSSEPVHQAATMCRKRGRIVLVGVTGLELSRADFYEKELSFQASCSYGPGRYDPDYEEHGHDYPVGLVRWTEQRNFEAVLDMFAVGALQSEALVSHRFELQQAAEAYDLLAGKAPSLGILLRYAAAASARVANVVAVATAKPVPASGERKPRIGVIGAGNYASRVLIPAFAAAGAQLQTLVSQAGVSAAHFAAKHGFVRSATDASATIADDEIDTVVIATRHDSHARYVIEALQRGKHVFVEKPLCLNPNELEQIRSGLAEAQSRAAEAQRRPPLLMVGFNRRFAPQVRKMHSLLATLSAPRAISMQVNAGAIPADHWTQDRAIGGGRIIGEACHFIDLARDLAGHPITDAQRVAMDGGCADTVMIQLAHADGSISSIHYLANGHRAVAKERIEVSCAGRMLQLDNFRILRGHGWSGFSKQRLWRQDKGQAACAAAYVNAISAGEPSPIAAEEIFEVSERAIEMG